MTLKGQRNNKNGKTSLSIFSMGLLTMAIALLYVTTIGLQTASALVSNNHFIIKEQKGETKSNSNSVTNFREGELTEEKVHSGVQCNDQRPPGDQQGCKFHEH